MKLYSQNLFSIKIILLKSQNDKIAFDFVKFRRKKTFFFKKKLFFAVKKLHNRFF